MMKLYNYEEYDYDKNKQGDLMVSCIGKRGKFTGTAETRIGCEKVSWMEFNYITNVKYNINDKEYEVVLCSEISEEKYKEMMIKHPELYTKPYLERMITAGLNNAYEHYKKDLRKK